MNRLWAILPVLILLAIGAISAINLTGTKGPGAGLSDGRDAPNRTFESLTGATTELNFASPGGDKAILVNLFASWCAPCEVEHPFLVDLGRAYPDQVYGLLYKDTPENGQAFLTRMGDPFKAIGLDPDGQGGLDFGLTGVPETFIISPEGEILLHVRGMLDDQSVLQISDLLN